MKRIKDIEKIVCDYFSLQHTMLHQKTRRIEIVKPRQIVMFFALNEGFSESVVASFYNQDRSTVYHSRDTVIDLTETNKIYRDQFFSIKNLVEGIEEDVDDETISAIIDREVEDILSLVL